MTDEVFNLPMSLIDVRNMVIADGGINKTFTIVEDSKGTDRHRRSELKGWCVRNTQGRWFYYSMESHLQTMGSDELISFAAKRWFGWTKKEVATCYCFENPSDAILFRLTWGGGVTA